MRDFTAALCLFVAARNGRACRDRNRNARALPRARLAFLNTGGLTKKGTLITPNTFDYTLGEHTKVTEVGDTYVFERAVIAPGGEVETVTAADQTAADAIAATYVVTPTGTSPDPAASGTALTQCENEETGVSLTADVPASGVKYYKVVVSDTAQTE